MPDNLQLLKTALFPLLVYDADSLRITDVNSAALKLYGYCRDQFLNMTIKDLRPESDLKKLEQALAARGNNNEFLHEEIYTHKKANGELIQVEISSQQININQKISRLVAIKDVTERVNVIRKLKENESNLSNAQRLAKLGYWKLDLTGRYIYCSDEVFNIWGTTKDEFPKDPDNFLLTIHPRDRSTFAKKYAEMLFTGGNIYFKHRIILKDGSIKWVHQRGSVVLDENKQPKLFEGTSQDITDNTILEASLKETKERYDFALKATSDVIWDWNLKDEKINYAGSIEKMFGYPSGEFKSAHNAVTNLIHPDDADRIRQSLNLVIEDPSVNFWEEEYRYLKSDQSYVYVNDKAILVRNSKGKTVRMVGAMRDITERKKYEMLLQQLNENLQVKASELSRSNAELEQFAYVASHDLQEPLRMIKSFLALLNINYVSGLDDKAKRYIGFAINGAERMENLIKDLLKYSLSTTDFNLEITNLNEIIGEIKNAVAINFPDKKVQIISADLPTLLVPRSGITQVLQNLIYNAIKYQAIDVSPVIKIDVVESETEWTFAVADNGIGISEEYLEKIFTIFKRLHSNNEYSGSGIGLSICKKIIEQLGGNIWAKSGKKVGSVFYFTILKKLAIRQ